MLKLIKKLIGKTKLEEAKDVKTWEETKIEN